MTIDSNTLFQILGALGSLVAMIWYVSSVINDIKKELSTSNQLNSMQEKKIDALEMSLNALKHDLNNSITYNHTQCRDGRVKIWEDLNELKLKVATLEAKEKKA